MKSMPEVQRRELLVRALGIAVIVSVGLGLGIGLAGNSYQPPFNILSSVIGWIYFAAWSISFYPQVYLNWERQSVVGLSFDFEAYNLLGFLCYSAFNACFYWDAEVQSQYEAQHNGKPNVVQVNDVFFAFHAVTLTLVHLLQIAIYDRGSQTFSRVCIGLISVAALVIATFALLVRFVGGSWWTWLTFLYVLSYIKLLVSLIKYIPQVYLNYHRKSTVGWNMDNVILDFAGGSLSVIQLLMDCGLSGDWSGISGDPVKFGLGFCSMFFDIIFIVQHYCLYPSHGDEKFRPSVSSRSDPVLSTNTDLESLAAPLVQGTEG